VAGMRYFLLMIAVVALVGCGDGKKEVMPKPAEEGIVKPTAVPANIADPIVEKAIRKELKKSTGELTKADLGKVTELELGAESLTELPKGLEKLTQLTSLNLGNNQLTDVKGLEKLTQLTSLGLNDNKLTDVKGLEKLILLEELNLNNNQLTDVKGLEKLTQVEFLFLGGNQLTDVKGLEKLTQLTFLRLDGNPDLTKAQIAELQKALPSIIESNAKK